MHTKMFLLSTMFGFSLSLYGETVPAPAAGPKTFVVDAKHSTIGFSIKHLMISKVKGNFDKFEGEFTYDTVTKTFSKVTAKIDVASINTREEKRDEHLRSKEYFAVEPNHPKSPNNTILFELVSYQPTPGQNTGEATGKLTMKGVTKEIKLTVEEGGVIKDPQGKERAAFSAHGMINREDFGVVGENKVLEAGGVAIGKEVELIIDVEGVIK